MLARKGELCMTTLPRDDFLHAACFNFLGAIASAFPMEDMD
ncbi:hypothetical protein DES53_1159 [Roseimicrobium gellanilyticum]|uniref:Uncharacterized protein n=2 Tax=Roseimicrobium gellanilyticum TaxID=748857 RepID=A0A366H4N3_9BACT|nr:hypothetical protein DES53_1159 [Roseimicrobium gellanilyticum]